MLLRCRFLPRASLISNIGADLELEIRRNTYFRIHVHLSADDSPRPSTSRKGLAAFFVFAEKVYERDTRIAGPSIPVAPPGVALHLVLEWRGALLALLKLGEQLEHVLGDSGAVFGLHIVVKEVQPAFNLPLYHHSGCAGVHVALLERLGGF